jgi:hypothetical protein
MTAISPVSGPLGQARLHPPASLLDPMLAALVSGHRRRVLGGAFPLTPAELEAFLPEGPLHASPMESASPWYLILGDGDPVLASGSGQVITGQLPALDEARAFAGRATGRTVVAGELVVRRGTSPVAALLAEGAGASTADLDFVGNDLLFGGDSEARMPLGAFDDRLPVLGRLLHGGNHARIARVDAVAGPGAVAGLYRELVETGKARGLYLRAGRSGRLFRVTAPLHLAAVVVGYTERAAGVGQVSSLLLALERGPGQLQILGLCSHLGDEATRHKLHATLARQAAPSAYRHPGPGGELVRFVRPDLRVEIRATDAAAEDSAGRKLRSMVLSFDGQSFAPVAPAASAHLSGPALVRVLTAAQAKKAAVGLGQLAARVWVEGLERAVVRPVLGQSEIVRREVWVKPSKNQIAVRKVVAWKTHKHVADPSFPAFVVQLTDYSPARKEPLEREVHPAPTLEAAMSIADRLVTENIKKGWSPAR